MSISKITFNQQCFNFVVKCHDHSCDWSIIVNTSNGVVELSMRELRDLDLTEKQDLMLVKNQIDYNPLTNELWNYEYNVVYNDAYETPVMYFNVSNRNGSPIEPADILANLSTTETLDLHRLVNQVEHPLLFRPFFMVHPCRTKDFMQPHCDRTDDNHHVPYLITWLSTVGTLLGIRLDLSLGTVASDLVRQV